MIDSIDVQENKAVNVRLQPDSRWIDAITARILDPDGKTVATPAAVLDDYDNAVSDNPTPDLSYVALSYDDVGLPVRGRVYQISEFNRGAIQVEVEGAHIAGAGLVIISLVGEMPWQPTTDSPFQGFEVAVTIPAIAKRGFGYRLIAETATDSFQLVFNVCRVPFSFPLSVREIRDYMLENWKSAPESKDEEWISNRRDVATSMLRSELLNAKRYPDRVWDRARLYNAAWLAVKIELAARNFIPKGEQTADYKRTVQSDFETAIGKMLGAISAYDADDDNVLSDAEKTRVQSRRMIR